MGGIDFSVWKIHLTALNFPEVGNESVFYPDLGLELKVIPLNTLTRKSTVEGFADGETETEDDVYDISQLK